jgi:transposase
MTLVALSPKERELLETLATRTPHAKVLRRAQALLWLDHGESPSEVAARLRVTRQTIYNWVHAFQGRSACDLTARLADGARRGRPRTAYGIIDPLIKAVIDQDPRALGYRSTVWTAPLLASSLWEEHDLAVSHQSVRLAIARLDYRWKRPRHRLARRATTWRQAKGGSNVDSAGASGPSC